jgi:hypothetical protein
VSRDERFATMKGSDCPIDHATLKKISLKTSILVRQFSKLDFVRFWLCPVPEDAVVCDVTEGLIEGQEASAHVVDVFEFSAVWPVVDPDLVICADWLEAGDRRLVFQ